MQITGLVAQAKHDRSAAVAADRLLLKVVQTIVDAGANLVTSPSVNWTLETVFTKPTGWELRE